MAYGDQVWNRVPQFFYDLLGRVVPGSVLLLTLPFVWTGPDAAWRWFMRLNEKTGAFVFASSALFFLASYFIGSLLPSWLSRLLPPAWAGSPRLHQDGAEPDTCDNILGEHAEDVLKHHQKIQEGIGSQVVRFPTQDPPPLFMFLDQVRLGSQGEALRLVKLRSEIRAYETIAVGYVIFLVVNVVLLARDYLGHEPHAWHRAGLEAWLLLVAAIAVRERKSLYDHFVVGVFGAWLNLAAMGRLPGAPTPPASGPVGPPARHAPRPGT